MMDLRTWGGRVSSIVGSLQVRWTFLQAHAHLADPLVGEHVGGHVLLLDGLLQPLVGGADEAVAAAVVNNILRRVSWRLAGSGLRLTMRRK